MCSWIYFKISFVNNLHHVIYINDAWHSNYMVEGTIKWKCKEAYRLAFLLQAVLTWLDKVSDFAFCLNTVIYKYCVNAQQQASYRQCLMLYSIFRPLARLNKIIWWCLYGFVSIHSSKRSWKVLFEADAEHWKGVPRGA